MHSTKRLNMIQRIQSVYLAIAGIALIVLYFLPVASFLSELSYLEFYITHLDSLTPGVVPLIKNTLILPLGVFNGFIILATFMSIFFYQKRTMQLKIVRLSILMNLILISLIFFVYSPLIGRSIGTEADYSNGYGMYMTLISLIMLVLANRGIIKDEKLVRSADRLR